MTGPDDTRGPRERAYDEHIAPLMSRIIELCKEHRIPMLASFELDIHEGDPLYCTTCMVGPGFGVADDRLVRACDIVKPPPAQWAAYIEYPDGRREKVAGSDVD